MCFRFDHKKTTLTNVYKRQENVECYDRQRIEVTRNKDVFILNKENTNTVISLKFLEA